MLLLHCSRVVLLLGSGVLGLVDSLFGLAREPFNALFQLFNLVGLQWLAMVIRLGILVSFPSVMVALLEVLAFLRAGTRDCSLFIRNASHSLLLVLSQGFLEDLLLAKLVLELDD